MSNKRIQKKRLDQKRRHDRWVREYLTRTDPLFGTDRSAATKLRESLLPGFVVVTGVREVKS